MSALKSAFEKVRPRRTPRTTMSPLTWVLAPLLPDPLRRHVLDRERHGFDRCGFPPPTGSYAERVAGRAAQVELMRQRRAATAKVA